MAGLMNINTQWFYLITDSNKRSEIVIEQIKTAKDGYNLAFLYNASEPDLNECKVSMGMNIHFSTHSWGHLIYRTRANKGRS